MSRPWYECVKCQQVHVEESKEYEPHLMFQSKHGIRRNPPPPVNPDAALAVNAGPFRAPEPPTFTFQIDERTTLGELQVVIACLGIDMRWWFRAGRYHCVTYASGRDIKGDGSGDTLAQAVREAVLQLRSRTAVQMIGDSAR